MHLPAKDFRPYKVGNNITANMIIPEDAPKAIMDYHWKFNVNGKEQIVTTRGSYPSIDGEFVSVETEEIQPGYEAPIHDFSIERDGQDFTEDILSRDQVLMIVMYNLGKAESEGLQAIKSIANEATTKGYDVIGITASNIELQQEIAQVYGLNFEFYFCDETALKTIVRSNPGILKLNKGTIIQKLHWNDIDDLTF
jgi:peroxiredoxin